MILGQASKPILKADLSVAREVEAMERMPRGQWSPESGGDKSSCSVPMMIYRDALKSNNQDSSIKVGQKFSSSESHLNLPSEIDMEIKESDLSSSSSTATITNSSENAAAVRQVEERSKGNGVDHPSKKTNDARVKNSHSPQRSLAISPLETSSGISVASAESDSTSSSMESRIYYQDQEKSLSKNSVSESATSSCVLSVANFTGSSANLTPGLIHTAYSRLKDRDMLYRKRIRELEKEVKKVPILEMKLATLKEENHLLLLQLKFCSGKTRSSGFGDNFPYNAQGCGSSSFDSKHLNDNNGSPGSFVNSSSSSGVSEIPNLELPCEEDRATKHYASLKKTVSHQNKSSNSVSPEMANRHVSTTVNDVRQNVESKKQEVDPQNKENKKREVPNLSDLSSAQCNSTDLYKKDKFCLKCPRCFFRISDETLQTNLQKDQNIQTDPSLFTSDRGTQTSNDGTPKSQPTECFIQNLEKFFCEIGVNNSEQPAADQILNILQYIAYYVSDDSKQGCNTSEIAPTCSQFRAKLKNMSSESTGINTTEVITAPVKTESATVHTVKEMPHDLTKQNNRCKVFESCFDETQKENNQLRMCSMKKTSSNTSAIQNSDNDPGKNAEPENPAVKQDLIYSLCGSTLKTKRELRSVTLNHLPTSPFLLSPEDRRANATAQNGRSTSSSSQISEFADYDTESFSTEDESNEMVQVMQMETGPKKIYESSDSDSNEAQSVGAFGTNGRNSGPKYNEGQDIAVEDERRSLSEGSSYHTPENKEGCHSPSLESDPSDNSEMMPSIVKEQENAPKERVELGSQTFEVDIQNELIFPDEVTAALKRINDYLVNPKENPDKKSLREPVDLVKRHWFGIICSSHACPSLLQKYLNAVSQYSSILSQWIINLHDAFGNSILHFTVANKRFAMLDALLQTGICDVNKRNKAGFTGAMLASVNKLHCELDRQIMRKLLRMSDLNARSYLNGETALTLASGHGVEDMVELLLEAGADVNVQDTDGSTALMYAAEHGFVDVARRLVVHPGCDLSLKDDDGMDACCVALKAGYPNLGLLIYFHAFGDQAQFSKKRSGKCKKWLKTSTRNSTRHYSRGSVSLAIPDRA